jgi:hypothetical protein
VAAIRTDIKGSNLIGVPLEYFDVLTRIEIPQAHGVISVPRDSEATVGAQSK